VSPARSPHRVVIAGGGVAGLEAMLALHALAGDRVQTTLVEPRAELVLDAGSVSAPFGAAAPHRYDLESICADHGAQLATGALERVTGHPPSITTRAGEELPFDSLVVAVGARRAPAYYTVTTFRGTRDVELVHGLVQDLEGGYLRRLAFVVPSGVTWPLPLYELALMTAERADTMCLRGIEITVVTPEHRPLEVFGDELSDALTAALDQAGVRCIVGTDVTHVEAGLVFDVTGREVVHAQRVIALPLLTAPRIAGLPTDADGFIRSDGFTRVEGLTGVYAVGDASSHAIKQGGVGAQQAGVAARQIAIRLGLDIETTEFHPDLRAKLLTGGRPLYVRRDAADGPGVVADHPLWWPPAKVAAPHLAAYLERRDHGERGPAPAPPVHVVHAQGDPSGGVEILG
jgi:sulfide:quinone oxidoreductase